MEQEINKLKDQTNIRWKCRSLLKIVAKNWHGKILYSWYLYLYCQHPNNIDKPKTALSKWESENIE
jgi:hypothetical protein